MALPTVAISQRVALSCQQTKRGKTWSRPLSYFTIYTHHTDGSIVPAGGIIDCGIADRSITDRSITNHGITDRRITDRGVTDRGISYYRGLYRP